MSYVLQNRALPSIRIRLCTWPVTSAAIILLTFGVFLFYFCYIEEQEQSVDYYASSLRLTTRYSMDQMRDFAFKNAVTNHYKPSLYIRWNFSFNRIVEDADNRFDIDRSDVIVFIHIQKTAGTSFERFLVKYLNITRPCICNMGKKRCNCYRPRSSKEFWLFSRYSTGWACGLHADFTELFVSGCVDQVMDRKEGKHTKRRYYYTTFLRDPVERFVSEYSHVERGANWLGARHVCNGKPPTPDELPMCFNPDVGWEGVGLEEFLACPFNLAFNRQTRMLADLTLVNCYNRSSLTAAARDSILLESAKNNLRNLAFFGIKERMNESQYLFEKVFDMKFTKSLAEWNKSKSQHVEVSEQQLCIIRELNALDIQLYKFANKLFDKRLSLMRNEDVPPPSYTSSSANILLASSNKFETISNQSMPANSTDFEALTSGVP